MDDGGLGLKREAALIERAKQGDGEAFGQIYDAYKNVLYAAIAYPRLRDSRAAEDAVQETFVLALEKIGQYRFEGKSILLWLKMIALNKVRERLAKDRRVSFVNDESLLDSLADCRGGITPETEFLANETQSALLERIRGCLGGLHERYRTALQLRLIHGKARAECAEALGVTVENFDIIFFRACRAFRKVYAGKYNDLKGGEPYGI